MNFFNLSMFARLVKKQTSNKRITQSYIFIAYSQQNKGLISRRKNGLRRVFDKEIQTKCPIRLLCGVDYSLMMDRMENVRHFWGL